MHTALIEPLESRIAPAFFSINAVVPGGEFEGNDVAGSQSVHFTISLSEPVSEAVSVDFETQNGTAMSGSDFLGTTTPQRVTFQPNGPLTQDVTVTVLHDKAFEADETFTVALSNPIGPGAALGAPTSAEATILNDDSAPAIGVTGGTFAEGNVSGTQNVFTLTLSEAVSVPVSVHVQTANGSATAGQDYTALPDTIITFAPGEMSKPVSIEIIGDTAVEGDESFTLLLSQPENGTIGTGQADATIQNDDIPGDVTLSIADATGSEASGFVRFTVSLSSASDQAITITYTTGTSGSATSGSDYTAASGQLTFAAGETSKPLTITVTQDTARETNETFFLTLSDLSGDATLADGEAMGTIVDDDPIPTVSIVGPNGQTAIDEGDSQAGRIFTVQLDRASHEAITVNIVSADGTATVAGADYIALSQSVTFAPGQVSKSVTLTVIGDTINEIDETLTLTATGDPAKVNSASAMTTVTLRNDERRLTVSDVTQVEGNSGTTEMIFTVTLNAVSDAPIVFTYATTDGTATSTGTAADYIAKTETITFAPGDISKEIRIVVNGDITGEADEFFLIDFTNVQNAAINQTQVRGTITDDDPFLSISDAQVVEGAGSTSRTMVFTVTLLRASGTVPVTVDYTTSNDTATGGLAGVATSDYVPISPAGTLTFNPGETSKTISVTVLGDNLAEADEKFFVTLSNFTGITQEAAARNRGTGTIIDDEGLVTVSNAFIVEGDSGTANMVFVLNLDRTAFSASVKVNYATADDTAVSTGALADYTAITNGSVTFGAGVTQQTISVPILGDQRFEGDQAFKLNLSVDNTGITDSNQASIATPTVVGTILDNDPLPRFSVTGGSVVEGAAGAEIVFTVNLAGGSDSAVTVNFATQPGTATAGADYTAVSTLLTFAPGETSKTVSVPVLDDATVEGNETFTGVLSNAVGATIVTSSAAGTVSDDDIVVSLVAGDFASEVAEGIGAVRRMTVNLSQAPIAGNPVTVTFVVAAGSATAGADFVLRNTSNTLTFAPGVTSQTIDFDIVGDALDEADNETFSVTLTGATNAVLATDIFKPAAIADDDTPPTITIEDAQLTEGNTGTSAMNFTVRLSAPSGRTVTVVATPTAGTATSADFSNAAQTVTFQPGETVKTLAVNITGDTIDETDETFTVVLGNPGNATIADDTATGTILDNDTRSLSIADLMFTEGDTGTKTVSFLVTLSSASAQVITIDYVTAAGSALEGVAGDYLKAMGTLTFLPERPDPANPGMVLPAQTSQPVVVTINGDTAVETDETFIVRLQPTPGTPVNALITDGEAIGTIKNDETTFTIDTSVAVVGAEEGLTSGAGNTLTFTIKRSNTLGAGAVSYTTVDGTAKSGATRPDYISKTGSVLFADGQDTQTVTVTLVNDLNFEADETFKLQLTGATNGVLGTVIEHEATITAGSDVRPTIEIDDKVMIEGSDTTTPTGMTFTVRLRSGGLAVVDEVEPITVTFITIAGTAEDAVLGNLGIDFVKVVAGSLNIPAGQSTGTITIQVTGDRVDEIDETFSVKLTGATAATGTGPTTLTIADDTGLGTITDDDDAPLLTFSGGAANGDFSVSEGSAGNFTIKPKLELRVGPGGALTHSEKEITFTLTTIAGTATQGVDYFVVGGTSVPVTIPVGSTSYEVEYTIVGDSIREANETFSLAVSDAQNVRATDAGIQVTITNDDAVPQLIANGTSVVEGASGQSEMVFTVSLLGATDQTVTVNFTTTEGTAKSTGGLPDFKAVSGALSFAPGETMKTVSVPIFGDTWAEADETFTLTLSGAANAALLTATGTGTILNGGDTTVGLVVQDVVSVENPLNADSTAVANPVMTFRVELTKTLASDVSFTAATRNGTAIATGAVDSDFVALNQSFSIAAGQTSVNVPVSLRVDSTFEATESFFLGVGNISNGVGEARGEGRGVILNDDFVFSDVKTLIYVDEDGDLATLKITKGNLTAATITLGPTNQTTGGRTLQLLDFTSNPALFNGTDVRISVEPQTGFAASGLTTDGQVDVGFIRGAISDTNTLQFTNGIDFGSIVVPGDVGKITAGDKFITPSIRGKISVESLGVRRTTSGAPDNTSEFLSVVNAISVAGDVAGVVKVIGNSLGNINSLKIGGALLGDATPANATAQSGIIFFTGTLGKATVGSIIGGANADSGVINGNTSFTAKIGSLHVLGDIVGGTGTRSGRVVAKTIGTVTVDGDLLGGGGTGMDADGTTPKGSDSGEILATSSIKTVKIGGDVKGGIQRNTGIISSSGTLGTLRIGGSLIGGTGSLDSGVLIVNRTLSNLTVIGDIVGAAGERSGTVQVGGTITKLTLGVSGEEGEEGGNLKGGSGENSGTISAGAGFISGEFVVSGGSIGNALIYGDIVGGTGDGGNTRTGNGSGGVQTGGQIKKLDLRGSLIGGDSPAAGVDTTAAEMTQSGFVLAGRLAQMIIGGDLKAGTDGGLGLADSGSIRVHENIGTLTILGNVIGNATNRAVISAGNNGPVTNGKTSPAISKLTVGAKAANGTVTGGDVSFLDVLAGYNESGTPDNPRGEASDENPLIADAQIGTVTLRGNVRALNLVAGADAGTDGLFGTEDDVKLTGENVVDRASVISSIAKVIIGGLLLESPEVHGIVAERVVSVSVEGTEVELNAGAGNDQTRVIPEETSGTLMQVNELTA